MSGEVLLEGDSISRSFGHVRALQDASIVLHHGEVRALAGANGSGKSTLIKVLSGYHVPEPGARLSVAGEEASFPMPAEDFYRLGIFCVHQDLGLIPELTVFDNLAIGEIARRHGVRLRRKELRRMAATALRDVGLRADLDGRIERLSRSDRALVALARAYSGLQRHREATGRCGVLVLDEITAFLPRHEVQVLQKVVRQVSSHGHGVIFVSHDLDEVMDSADSVTVLRDGRVVATASTVEMDRERLVRSMIGRDLREHSVVGGDHIARDAAAGTVRVSELSGGRVDGVNLVVHPGEIVGITGVLGSGFDLIPYLLFGAEHARAGTLRLGESTLDLGTLTPAKAFTEGVGLIPGDRHAQGLFMDLEIAENIGSLALSDLERGARWVDWRGFRREAASAIGAYGVVADGERSLPRQLSGGNQQKVLLARWLPYGRELLLLHEPVQGVDVGAREAIVELLKERARSGVPIICATSDYELLVHLCDRALIMKDGKMRYELTPPAPGEPLDKDRLVAMCISDVSEVA